MKRQYVLDLSSYQKDISVSELKSLHPYAVVIKFTEGLNYLNPHHHSLRMKCKQAGINNFAYYHFGRFTSTKEAEKEALYFIKKCNPSKGRLMIADCEVRGQTTDEVIKFLDTLHKHGYKAGFYTYKYLLPQFNLEKIHKHCDFFWIAAYPNGDNPTSTPNFHYFPSTNYVDIWQFTDNYKGKKLDCSITLTENANKLLK